MIIFLLPLPRIIRVVLLNIDTALSLLMEPGIAAFRLNVKLHATVVDRIRLSNIVSNNVLKLDISAALNLQDKGSRSVDVHILKLHTKNLALDEGNGRVGRVNNVTVENVNVCVDLLIETTEPDGAHTKLPVVVRVARSQQRVSVHLPNESQEEEALF